MKIDSEEERQDVLLAYTKTKGILLDMIDHVPLCSLDDLDRFKSMCQSAIDTGELEKMKNFPKINERALKSKRAALKKERGLVEEASDAAAKKKGKKNSTKNVEDLKELMIQGQKASLFIKG